MKQRFITLILVIFSLILCSCTGGKSPHFADGESIARNTYEQLLQAVADKDAAQIVNMFAPAVQKTVPNLQESAEKLISLIQGEILPISADTSLLPTMETSTRRGKATQIIHTPTTIETTQGKYHLALKQCTRDDYDGSNIGIITICIIDANNWQTDYTYWGEESQDIPGIHVGQEGQGDGSVVS